MTGTNKGGRVLDGSTLLVSRALVNQWASVACCMLHLSLSLRRERSSHTARTRGFFKHKANLKTSDRVLSCSLGCSVSEDHLTGRSTSVRPFIMSGITLLEPATMSLVHCSFNSIVAFVIPLVALLTSSPFGISVHCTEYYSNLVCFLFNDTFSVTYTI
jgi:hypothetical protein